MSEGIKAILTRILSYMLKISRKEAKKIRDEKETIDFRSGHNSHHISYYFESFTEKKQ